jgi:pre-rRNA-processing protein TSR1
MFSQHKAGKLKQVNKKHKNGGSKRAIKRAFGAGRVEGAAGNGKKGAVAADLAKNSRLNRANHSQQIMKNKRDQLWLQKRIGSSSGPPKVVALIPLSYSAKPYNCLATLISEASWSSITSAELQEQMKTGVVPMVHTQYNQFKARFSFIQAKMDIISALDAAKVADIVVFLVDGKSLNDGRSELITPVGMSCISALRAQGCPEVVACVQGMESFTGKALIDRRKLIHRTLESSISSDVKIVETAATQLCRQLFSASLRDIGWRSIRTYLVADSVAVSSVQAVDTSNGPVSRLRIGGYLRGRPLQVNSLVHITGLGTGRIASIVCDPSAQPGNTGRNRNGISSMTLTADTAQ